MDYDARLDLLIYLGLFLNFLFLLLLDSLERKTKSCPGNLFLVYAHILHLEVFKVGTFSSSVNVKVLEPEVVHTLTTLLLLFLLVDSHVR